jgi:hypothetical protein
MFKAISEILIAVLVTSLLAGCGHFDAEATWIPEVFRAAKYKSAEPDPEPNVALFLAENLDRIFTGETANVRFGAPRRIGLHWEACVASNVKGVTGNWLETVLVVEIEGGHVGSRRRASPDDDCDVASMTAI